MDSDLKAKLGAILGDDHLVTDAQECAYYSQDVYSTAPHTTKMVLRPGTIDELSRAVKEVTAAGYALFPRGGGLSYTGGYLPSCDKAATLDTARLNRIVEINREDMFITVEAGCRWADIHEALKDTGLRPPFWGTLSGLHATVGGSVSQNSIFFGSGLYGTSADNVIGLKVVAADGRIVTTGSAAAGASAFFRHYGPDLTGLFTGDCGALGIKAQLTLRLMAAPAFKQFGSFSFERYEDMLPAMSQISRRGLASECFGFDPFLQSQRLKRESLAKDIKSLANVIKEGGLKKGAKLAMAGRGYMKDVVYSFHVTTENHHEAAAAADMDAVRDIVRGAGGREIENSIPTLISANPFMPPNSMIGPLGERWAPVHAVTPHSGAVALMTAMEELFQSHREKIDEFGIGTGYLLTTVGASAMVLEPVFFWPDALLEFHQRNVEKQHLKKIKAFPENLEVRNFVGELREKLTKICLDHKAVHFQIGRTYRYKQGLEGASYNIVRALKTHMDPAGLINPGALGL